MLEMQLVGYNDFKFVLAQGAASQHGVSAFLDAAGPGDTVALDIAAGDFNKKIAHQASLNQWDLIYRYHYITVYGIRYRGARYASLEIWNDTNAGKPGQGYIWLLIGAFIVLLLFGSLYNNSAKRMPQTVSVVEKV